MMFHILLNPLPPLVMFIGTVLGFVFIITFFCREIRQWRRSRRNR